MNLVEGLGPVEARDVESSFDNLAVILLSLKIIDNLAKKKSLLMRTAFQTGRNVVIFLIVCDMICVYLKYRG